MRIILTDNVVKPIQPIYPHGGVTFSDVELDSCDNGFDVYTSGVLNNSSSLKYSDGNLISIRKDATTADLVYDSSANDVLYVGNCYIRGDNGEYLNITLDGDLEFITDLTDESTAIFNISEYYDTTLERNMFVISNGLYLLMSTDITNVLDVSIKKGGDLLSENKFRFGPQTTPFYNLLDSDDNVVIFNGISVFESTDMNRVPFDLYSDITSYRNAGFNTNSKWVSYDIIAEPSYNKTERLLALSDTIVDDFTVDYMVSCAPKGDDLVIGTNVDYMPFNMMPLNTFSTVTGDARVTEDIPTNESLKVREYLDIAINETQDVSASNIQLSFNGVGGLVQNFESGIVKYFHIPATFVDIDLNVDTSLKLAGATAGSTPETSDRIYKYNVTDNTSTPWTNELLSNSADGTWVCAWLQRQIDGTSKWVEYDVDTDSFIETTMVLESRGYYKYLKVGDTSDRIDEIVLGPNYRDAVIYINDMDFFENPDNGKFIIPDVSGYNNDAVLNLPDNVNVVSTEVGNDIPAILLNGSSTIDIPASITYKGIIDKTISLFSYMDDWCSTTTPSYMIYTDQYKNGSSLSWINHGLYDITALPDPSNNVVNILNANGDYKNSVILDDYMTGSNIAVCMIDNNMFIVSYLIDSTNTRLILVSSNGDKIRSRDHIGIELTNLLYGGYGTVYTVSSSDVYTLNPISLELDQVSVKSSGDSLVVKSDGSNGVTYGLIPTSIRADVTADGASVIYIDESSNIYINTEPVLISNDEVVIDVGFDSDDKAYYAVYDSTVDDGVVKLTIVDFATRYQETRKIILSGVGDIPNPKGSLSLSKMAINGEFRDVVIIQINSTVNQYAIYDTVAGSVIKISNFNTIGTSSVDVIGDTTGYKYNKVEYYNNNKKPTIKYLTTAYNGTENILEVRTERAETLDPFWNHMCVTNYTNIDDVNAKIYINANLIWTITTSVLSEYETNLTFGCSATTGSPLSVVNNVNNRSNYGAIANIMVINNELNLEAITLLHGKLSGGNTVMRWVIGGSVDTFVEQIDRMFKCKNPSSKSTYFDIILTGNFSDNEKEIIENYINSSIYEIVPVNSKLMNIEWK